MKTLVLALLVVCSAALARAENPNTFERLANAMHQSIAESRAETQRRENLRLMSRLMARADAGQAFEAKAEAERRLPAGEARDRAIAHSLLRIGERHAERNEFNGAYDAYMAAFRLWGRDNGVPSLQESNGASWAEAAEHLNRLAFVQARMGRHDEAAQSYRDALASLEAMRGRGRDRYTPEEVAAIRKTAEDGAAGRSR